MRACVFVPSGRPTVPVRGPYGGMRLPRVRVCVCSPSLHSVCPPSPSPLAAFGPMAQQQEVQAPNSWSAKKKKQGRVKDCYMQGNINKHVRAVVGPDWPNLLVSRHSGRKTLFVLFNRQFIIVHL